MTTTNDIFIEEGMLCIAVASASTSLKGYELSSQRPPAMLYDDGAFTEIPWLGVRIVGGRRCLCFDAKPFGGMVPTPAVELCGRLRDDAFAHLTHLAEALKEARSLKDWELDWNFSALPLSSIYFTDDAALLLPSKASAFIDATMLDEDRFLDREVWYVHEEANGFGKANYLFQLTYYVLSRTMPFASQDVRDAGYRPMPLRLFFSDDGGVIANDGVAMLCSTVDTALSMTKKDMYKVDDPYEYFLDAISKANEITTANVYIETNSKVHKDYLQKLSSKAGARRFLRRRGAALAGIVAGSAIVIAIAWYYIALALTPPTTAGLGMEGIVRAYYKAVNDLNLQGVNDSLARGCKSPDEMTVTNLEVTQKVRYAYEGTNPIVEAQSWLDEDMPAIPQGTMVYGIVGLVVETTGDDTAVAEFDFIRPYEDYEQETYAAESDSLPTGVYHDIVEFRFVQKNDWLEISDIDVKDETLVRVYDVPYSETPNAVSTMVLRTDSF